MQSQLKLKLAALGVAALVAVPACGGIPLPADKSSYAGHWTGENVDLRISPEGRVNYLRSNGSSNTKLNAPLQRFDGEDFVVGVWMITTTFDVTDPPHEVEGVWTMTVDGTVMTRVEP